MVTCLFYLVSRVVRLYKTIRSAQLTAVVGRRAVANNVPADEFTRRGPQDVAAAADLAAAKIGLAREMLGMHQDLSDTADLASHVVLRLQWPYFMK